MSITSQITQEISSSNSNDKMTKNLKSIKRVLSTSNNSITSQLKSTGAGPFGKASSRGLSLSDSSVSDYRTQISTCENWEIKDKAGKSNMRIRILSNFGKDPNGPAPGQYKVSHKQNGEIEGVPCSILTSRPKELNSSKSTSEGSGKIIYNLYGPDTKLKPGPKIVPDIYDTSTITSTTPKKLIKDFSLLPNIDNPKLKTSKSTLISKDRNSPPRNVLDLKTLDIRDKFAGSINNLKEPYKLAKFLPSPLDYNVDISFVRPSSRSVSILSKFLDKESNPNNNLLTGHEIPGPATYSNFANSFGTDPVTIKSKYIRPKTTGKISSSKNSSFSLKNYVSDYSFPKKYEPLIVPRGNVMKSTIKI